jgi:DNA-directed RNA polymerase II subunit RPB2
MDDLISDSNNNDMDIPEYSFSVPDQEIEQQDAWDVINKYFESKGLVGQQLDSYDEFIQNTIQVIANLSIT